MDKILSGFRKRDMPLAVDYRPLYKVSIIICILEIASRSKKASLNKLHFLTWALKTQRNRDFVKNIIDNENVNMIMSWGIEPALNKALAIGVAEDFLNLEGDKYILTPDGFKFYKKIESEKDLLKNEKEFLQSVGKNKITESFISDLISKLSN